MCEYVRLCVPMDTFKFVSTYALMYTYTHTHAHTREHIHKGATSVVQCGVVQGFSRSDAGGAVWCCTGFQQERRRWCSVVLYRASAEATPVVQCGFARYWRKNRYISCFQFFCSIYAERIAFSTVSMKRSTSPLVCGHNGAMPRCVNPRSLPKFLKSSP